MSKVTIQGDASGTGIFTIASPNSNTDRTLVLPDEAGTVLTTAGVPASAMPAGSVLQVVSVTKTDTFSSTATSFTDITGMAATITPTSASSKILVLVSMVVGPDAYSRLVATRLVRGSTAISATGATSVVGTSGATFYITGVQLEAGSVATPFEHRQYGQELALCQRYYNHHKKATVKCFLCLCLILD
jgi:hypothetical protein